MIIQNKLLNNTQREFYSSEMENKNLTITDSENSTLCEELNEASNFKAITEQKTSITTTPVADHMGDTVNNFQSASSVKLHENLMSNLEKDKLILQSELAEAQARLYAKEKEFQKLESDLRTEFLHNIEKLTRECNTLRKEKESIVIRYANSEKEVILEKKLQSDLEKKLKDVSKDNESLLEKIKSLTSERNKLSSALDNKLVEIAKLEKENEKIKEDFNSREIKIKWLQNKLKTEMHDHKETQAKLEQTLLRLNEMREEAEQVRKDCQEIIKCYQEAEEIKSVKLDSQLKQKLSELEVQRKENSDQEQVYHLLRQELETLKKKQRLTLEENNSLTLKIHSLEKERLEYEQTLCKLKDSQNLLKQEIVDLTARLVEMENLNLQLEREREKSAANFREVERLRSTNAELQADMDACHVKEGELLDFTEKLTAKTVHLQSDNCLLEVKIQALEQEKSQADKYLSEMQQKYADIVDQSDYDHNEWREEIQLLTRKLAEKTKNVEALIMKLNEVENQSKVMKRRHVASIKELSRELYHCRKRLENCESGCYRHSKATNLVSPLGSTTSLEDVTHQSQDFSSFCAGHLSPPVKFSGRKPTLK